MISVNGSGRMVVSLEALRSHRLQVSAAQARQEGQWMRGRISPRRSSLVSTLLAAVSSSTSSGESIVALEEITLTRDCWLLSDSYSNFHLELATLIGLDSCHGLAAVTEQNLYLYLPQTIPALVLPPMTNVIHATIKAYIAE